MSARSTLSVAVYWPLMRAHVLPCSFTHLGRYNTPVQKLLISMILGGMVLDTTYIPMPLVSEFRNTKDI